MAHLEKIGAGDCIFGNLPPDMVAHLCDRGGRYFHIAIPGRPRDDELGADDLDRLGARLVEVSARFVESGDDDTL